MKIKDGVSERIKERIDKLKTRKGHYKLLSDIFFPSRKREEDRALANQYADTLDKKIQELDPLIRSLRSHIDYIGDPDKHVAVYLLIGKAYTCLKAIVALVRLGFAFQIVELVRSSIESLYLATAFWEDGQEETLKKWFGGEIIGNKKSREVMDEVVNQVNPTASKDPIPMGEALLDVYAIYSEYTHSAYGALFDYIDVYKEDFDFEQYMQFHYNRNNFRNIDNLYVNILLGLKNFYIRVKDEKNLTKVEELLKQEGEAFATKEEIAKEMERYK